VLQARFKALLTAEAPFTQLYGMTEACCTVAMTPYPEHDTTGSIGYFHPNIDVKVILDDGTDVSHTMHPDSSHPLGRGEVCVRGPSITRGYFENPEANARDWDTDGYFRTGDIVHRDPTNGKWYIVDRKKELVKVRGFQVAPAEIEAVVLEHPGVTDCAVVGIPLSEDGSFATDGKLAVTEAPRAYVVLRESAEHPSEQEIYEWVKQRLAKYKWLEGGVRFIAAIPKTGSGKMMKRLLRERAAHETRFKQGAAKL
jgi:4-coumarate--CoA ligase